jgi:hypothetical protein
VTPTNAAPEANSPSVLLSGGNGATTLLLMSSPKIWAIVFEYCCPVIKRARNGEALPSGSVVSVEQPANIRTTPIIRVIHRRPPDAERKQALLNSRAASTRNEL